MRLNHNMMSLNAYRTYTKNLAAQGKSMLRVSSGDKITRTMDNAAGMAQREQLRIQIRGLQMSQKNMQDGISMLQSAGGGLENVITALNRIRELTVSCDELKTKEDRESVQKEIDQMLNSVDSIANNTEFNGIKLLGKGIGEPPTIKMSAGANVGEYLDIPINNLTTTNLTDTKGNNLRSIDIVSLGNLDKSLDIIDASLDAVISIRSKYGALENRMESVYYMQRENSLIIESADSSIGDVDIAEEMMELTKSNLLVEACNAMIAQSNKLPQEALRVLERIR
ncbi:flagellin/flagellar hook associated protein [Clostridium putrefaciens]|uniref:Flagellin n=1 Tax=Clostridium putrefaciens TaxID=99675 RepID=A0A381J8A0_9CLOT|nr:flagellin [Clostridium putrefaciens]SUY47490.1 flagellin/flagellar hook associated protein [Clostridium putrefaciens]